MKTRRRNKAAAIAFFVFAVALSPFASYWLAVTYDVPDWAIFCIAIVYGSLMMIGAQVLFAELEHRAEEKRVDADLKRLHEMWDQTMRENGHRP